MEYCHDCTTTTTSVHHDFSTLICLFISLRGGKQTMVAVLTIGRQHTCQNAQARRKHSGSDDAIWLTYHDVPFNFKKSGVLKLKLAPAAGAVQMNYRPQESRRVIRVAVGGFWRRGDCRARGKYKCTSVIITIITERTTVKQLLEKT